MSECPTCDDNATKIGDLGAQLRKLRNGSTEAHDMLTRLGAPGRPGQASVRERLASLLGDYRKGKPLPTNQEVGFALYGPRETNMTVDLRGPRNTPRPPEKKTGYEGAHAMENPPSD